MVYLLAWVCISSWIAAAGLIGLLIKRGNYDLW